MSQYDDVDVEFEMTETYREVDPPRQRHSADEIRQNQQILGIGIVFGVIFTAVAIGAVAMLILQFSR